MKPEITGSQSRAIAVVGLGCRFPDADDSEQFWKNIVEAKVSFRPVPKDRWNHEVFFNPSQREVDKTWTATGGFIQDIRSFAALHYGIAPRRLEVMDPQQRLLIEATRVAIQDAGYEVRGFDRSRAGVFIGISVSEYKNIASARLLAMELASGQFGPAAATQELRDAVVAMAENIVPLRAFSLSGALTALAAASISQTFDLGGPSYTIDAACASASVAINDAVVQLRAGLIDSALAGGVYLNLQPDNLVSFTRIGAISPSGVCRPFDARADGFVQSDGVGMVFLKRLDDALRDGDHIYALIRGTGCNNDGRGEGPMTPRVGGQLAALHRAYADAAISPATVGYFEAHGTATAVGDPVEIEALGTLLGEAGVEREAPALLGSVKGNIGHAMSAAGIAGFVKALKVLEHGLVPPQPGFERPHPALGLDRFPLRVSQDVRPLERRGGPARVALSSFGFGGTNSHLVLEEAPARPRRTVMVLDDTPDGGASVASASEAAWPEAILVTAPTLPLLARHLTELAAMLEARLPSGAIELGDIAYTLNARRKHERYRAVIGARDAAELLANLRRAGEALAEGEPSLPLQLGPHVAVHDSGAIDAAKRKVAFMFPGQGAQKVGLLDHARRRFPRFSEWLGVLTAGTSDLLPRSLTGYLYPEPPFDPAGAEAELTRTEICQPVMAALGLSLAALLEDAGVRADLSLGHSLGEWVALGHARAIDPVDLVRLVAVRGEVMRALPLEDPGTMAAANAPLATVRAALDGVPGVWIANINQPRQVSISGTRPAVAEASRRLAERGVEVRPLLVSHAFHTPLLEGMRARMEPALAGVGIRAPEHRVISAVTDAPYGAASEETRRTLLEHATANVDFAAALEKARAEGASIFVNVGAGGMLAGFARATLGPTVVTVTLSPLDDDGGYELVRGLATLAAAGIPVDFEAVYRGEARRVVELPSTPLEREEYWMVKATGQPRARLDHPLPAAGEPTISAETRPPEAPRPGAARPLAGEAGAPEGSVRSARAEEGFQMTKNSDRGAPDQGRAAPINEELVRLFAQQAKVLEQHAEILAAQNRVLFGATALPPVQSAIAAGAAALAGAAPHAVAPGAPGLPATGASSALPVAAAQTAGPPVPLASGDAPVLPAAAVSSASPAPVAAQRAAAHLREPSPGLGRAEVRDRVLEIVARISAFPRGSLRDDQRLVDELGFDSLMVADLGGAIEGAFPGTGGLPQSLFSLSTTVGDLTEHLAKKLARAASAEPKDPPREGTGARAEEEAPARRWRPIPAVRARRSLGAHDPRGETWLLTGEGGPLSAALASALERRGARVVHVEPREGDFAAPTLSAGTGPVAWPEARLADLAGALEAASLRVDGVIHAAALGVKDRGTFVNPVLGLHPLAQRLTPERFTVLTALGGKLGLERSPALAKNVLQAALLGFTKALARERPGAAVRVIDLDPTEPPATSAEAVIEETLAAEVTVEVGLAGGVRHVAELVPVEEGSARPRRALGKTDVVLITGGAGELGALAARSLAARGLGGIILVGRRPADASIEALLAELSRSGTRAMYAAADVTHAPALESATRAAVEALGPVTLAIHAAGAIEDAPVAKKPLESVERVMNPKVLGVQSILRVYPRLQELVIFSSWAGRFGSSSQTDYAAANELVDHLAIAGAGNVRVVAIDWPPWSSTAMVRSIPAVIQGAMKAAGVTFLSDREGIAIFDAILSGGSRGVEVVGRALPRHETRALLAEPLAPEAHPYLDDHRLKGRPVLPLASALDLLAFTAGAGDAPGPLVVEELELVRGLVGGETALARGATSILSDGTWRSEVELRAAREGQGFEAALVAYRARVTSGGPAGLPADASDSAKEAAEELPFDLDTFYREHTFHGPRLRGIAKVTRMSARGIEGELLTSSIRAWMPGTPRSAWVVDPLTVDGTFQLAAYWAIVHLGKAGYPTGFDRLVLLAPFGASSGAGTTGQPGARTIHARLSLRDAGEDTFEGNIWWHDASGAPIGAMLGVRGRFVEGLRPTAPAEAKSAGGNGAGAGGNGHAEVVVPEESHRIELFPELEALDQRFQMAELIGLRNPYFHVHAGTARNTSVVDGEEMLNFSSYNYLGFSGHPEVVAAAKEAIERYGTSVSASRVASGERPLHRDLEAGIAEHVGVDDSVVFVSGHATNVTTIGHLFDRNDLILHDALIHDSILQGIYLSGATRRPFPHGDPEAADRILSQVRGNYRRVLLCAEGIYSMDGDTCDLPRLIEVKKRHKCLLMIDEAHSIGVLGPAGRGIAHHFPGVDPRDVDLWMGTLSKSFASCGGYIAGSKALVRYLKYTAPGFVYSAGITPPNAAAALKSLELMHRNPEVVETLRQRSRYFLEAARSRGIDTGHAIGAAVIPAIIGNSLECMRLAQALAARRINVQPIVYPAVEDNASRLRFFISSTHTEAELLHTAEVLVEERDKVRGAMNESSSSLSL